jgi:predicted dehydrogenase
MNKKKIKLGIIGCGEVTKDHYLPIINNKKEWVLTSCCDIIKSKAEDISKSTGAKVFTDYNAMIKESHLDLIILATKEQDHFEILQQIVESGLPIFCEKPLLARKGQFSIDAEDLLLAKKLMYKVKDIKYKLGINFNYRYAIYAKYVKEEIKNNTLGEIYVINISTSHYCWVHMIDLIIWWFGDFEMVYGFCNRKSRALLGISKSKIKVSINSTKDWPLAHSLFHIQIIGSLSRFEIDDVIGKLVIISGLKKQIKLYHRNDKDRMKILQTTISESLETFINEIQLHKQISINYYDALKQICVDAALNESNKLRRPIKIINNNTSFKP